jgi:hypothetical protein
MKRNRLRLATSAARTPGAGVFVCCAMLCLVSCIPREPINIKSHDPSLKIPAIKQEVAKKDTADVGQMVKDLDSDDPAVRFYSVEGLRRLTGDTFGYHYYDDEDVRRPAVKRWQEWLQNRGAEVSSSSH